MDHNPGISFAGTLSSGADDAEVIAAHSAECHAGF